jgi:hypothetical protein
MTRLKIDFNRVPPRGDFNFSPSRYPQSDDPSVVVLKSKFALGQQSLTRKIGGRKDKSSYARSRLLDPKDRNPASYSIFHKSILQCRCKTGHQALKIHSAECSELRIEPESAGASRDNRAAAHPRGLRFAEFGFVTSDLGRQAANPNPDQSCREHGHESTESLRRVWSHPSAVPSVTVPRC